MLANGIGEEGRLIPSSGSDSDRYVERFRLVEEMMDSNLELA